MHKVTSMAHKYDLRIVMFYCTRSVHRLFYCNLIYAIRVVQKLFNKKYKT